MKRNTIKSWIITAALSFSMSGMVSCVGDLDVTPIDPSVTMEFDRNYLLIDRLSILFLQNKVH